MFLCVCFCYGSSWSLTHGACVHLCEWLTLFWEWALTALNPSDKARNLRKLDGIYLKSCMSQQCPTTPPIQPTASLSHSSSPQVSALPTKPLFAFLPSKWAGHGWPKVCYNMDKKNETSDSLFVFSFFTSPTATHTYTPSPKLPPSQAPCIHSLCRHIYCATHTPIDHILTSLPPTISHTTHPQQHLTDFISCEAWVRRLQCIYRSNTWLLAILMI